MIRLTKYTIHLISGLLLALLTAGCVADRNVSDCITEGEDVELEFALQVPALETSLRQLSADQEKQINSVQVLVFKTDGITDESQETLEYIAPVKSFETGADGITRIRCGLKATTKPMRVVCIANHNVNAESFVGKTKQVLFEDDVMKKAFTAAWPTTGTNYYIPMWGESDKQAVSRTTKFNSCEAINNGRSNTKNEGVIHLVRALARIDVGVNFDESKPADENAQGGTDFKIKSVRVYRYAQSMYVTGTQATTFRMDGATREPLPHTPAGMTPAADGSPLVFKADAEVDGYIRNIYIPEISNAGKDKTARTCLVIGGSYKGGKETFYRVDFITRRDGAPKDEITKQLDVLRNHRYRFNITKVKGNGTDTPEEALTTEPVNINWDILVWDDAEIDKIVYDGQYYLTVSQDKFTFGKNPAEQSFVIRTNWPQGYKIVKADGSEWAKSETEATTQGTWAYFTEPAGQTFEIDKDQTSTISVLENATGSERKITREQLFVKAGRIKWPLEITQQDKVMLDVKVYEQKEDGSWDPSKPITSWECKQDVSYKFRVIFTPGADLERIPLQFSENYDWDEVLINKGEGYAIYTVALRGKDIPEDRFTLVETSRFRVTMSGAEAYTDFVTRYTKFDAIPFADPALTKNMLRYEVSYALSNQNQRFFIKATAPYRLTVVDIRVIAGDPNPTGEHIIYDWSNDKMIREVESSILMQGDKIDFQTYDYIGGGSKYNGKTVIQATATLKITSTDPKKPFPEKTFKINLFSALPQPEANSYIMKLGQMPILIPCSQINRAADYYDQFAEELDDNVTWREGLTLGDPNGLSDGMKRTFDHDGGWKLHRLDPEDNNWHPVVVWSTLTKDGYETGFNRVEKARLSVGGKNYILVDVKPYGTGSGEVQPGTAVIAAVRNSDNKILWNWMIWAIGSKEQGLAGYPWEARSGSQISPRPYMNRPLGAQILSGEGKTTAGDKYDKEISARKTGLYYVFGIPIPYHLEERAKEQNFQSSVSKVYYDPQLVPKNALTDMPLLKGATAGKAFWPLRMLIENPTKMCHRESEYGFIYEHGTTLGGSTAIKAAMWQGRPDVLLRNERARQVARIETAKTPFDPSPYGWKVPAAGAVEFLPLTERHDIILPKTGFFVAGHFNDFRPDNVGDGVMLHVSTPYADRDYDPMYVYMFGSRWFYSMGGGGIPEGDLKRFPSNANPVLCIENEEESDYLNYTEEGFKALRNNY